MSEPRIYLAGPEVFLKRPDKASEYMKSVCSKYCLCGVFPGDDSHVGSFLAPKERAQAIFRHNTKLIDGCDGVLASLWPFRGVSADPGTVWEIGYAYGLGKPVIGYYENPFTAYGQYSFNDWHPDYKTRVHRAHYGDIPSGRDAFGWAVENFGLSDNLMISCSLRSYSVFLENAVASMANLLEMDDYHS